MVALLPAFQTLALFASLAAAAPASHVATRDTHAHTHHVRALPNGVQVRSYHRRSTFEVFPRGGIDHPLSKRGSSSVRESGMAFINSKLGDTAVWRSTLARNNTSSHVYATQQINGIPVVNSVANVAIGKNGKVTSWSQNFSKAPAAKIAPVEPKVKADEAVKKAAKALDGKATGKETPLRYYALEDDSLVLTQAVELQLKNKHTVRAFVDAQTGDVRGMFDFTAAAAYRVSPIDSQDPSADFELLQDPEDLQASPQGWTNFEGQETGQTVGNNAVSFFDDPNAGVTTQSAPDEFDFNINLAQDPTQGANLDASRVNAFFAMNTVHDIAFRYGFDEAAFNFQQVNFGNAGVANDVVLVSVQDTSGTDNAQFTTLEDGQQGVMQMFLFTATDPQKDGALVNAVVVHEAAHGITNRMTGGGTADCLQSLESGGLGEGWSDAFAEWTEQTSGNITDYATGTFLFEGGIRRFPYSVDKQVNPLLFSDVAKLDEVHDIGEVWAEALHVVHADLVAKNGFSADANTNPEGTGGNVIWMHLFIDALAIQPCNPTFLDARLAWIQADQARFNGANECDLWAGFAKTGMGPDAADGVDDFGVPAVCGGTSSDVGSSGAGGNAGGAASGQAASATEDAAGTEQTGTQADEPAAPAETEAAADETEATTGTGRRGGRRGGRGRGRNAIFGIFGGN